MPRYRLEVREHSFDVYEVEAASPEEAEELVYDGEAERIKCGGEGMEVVDVREVPCRQSDAGVS